MAPPTPAPTTTKPPLTPGKIQLPLPGVASHRPTRVTSLIYGFSGAGKSFMFRSLLEHPKLHPALILVFDAGHVTYQDLIDDAGTFSVVAISQLSELDTMLSYLLRSNPFRTLGLDNLTELHRTALLESAKRRVAKGRGTMTELEQSDYGAARLQVLNLLSIVTMQMPALNIFATAAAVETADEANGLMYIQPAFAGKLSAEVPGYFDACGYLYRKTPTAVERRAAEKEGKADTLVAQRVLVTNQTTTVLQARNRGGFLGNVMQDPTYPKIYNAFTGGTR